MSKAIYISTTERHSGKSVFVLGLMDFLLGNMEKVGYFRLFIDDTKNQLVDSHTSTVLSHFNIDIPIEEAYAFKRSQIIDLLQKNDSDQIIDTVISKYKQLEARFDFIIIEGSDFTDNTNINEFDLNVEIAKNLGIPAVIISSGEGKTQSDIAATLQLAINSFENHDVEVLAAVANKIETEDIASYTSQLQQLVSREVQLYAFPYFKKLSHPSLKEIMHSLNGKVLYGAPFLHKQTGSFCVGAMQLRNYLKFLKSDSLVITPGDRADVILGALQANLSDNYPQISGIVLTGGITPEKTILQLIEGFDHRVPIISVPQETFEAANLIGNIKPKIYTENKQKIQQSIAVFKQYINEDIFSEKLISFTPDGITPRMFQYNLQQRAKQHKKHIVLPEGNDDRILMAASRLLALDIVDITLLGNPIEIERKSAKLNLPIQKAKIVQPTGSPQFEAYAKCLYQLRKHKNVNLDMAKDMMSDVSYFGTMMVHLGDADGMVSGAVHTTQHTIRPALQFVKTKPQISVVSSIFFMCLEDRVTVFGDCAINPNPNAEELSEIAISSADSSKMFGIEPKVAMLSYSSGKSGKGEDVEIVQKATEIVRKKRPDIKIEGPIQYDAAVDKHVAQKKLPNSEVAGQASVFIFPDLNTGNNTYKAVQRETGALAIGPMLQGLNKPVNDLSRGCTVEDVFNTVIITAIQAQDLSV
ncbi:MAG: phosphate acetyltransferase [Flavobacteriaceae bacterium]|nr:phosphate acetyltransferase [Flavobacteriaceae bacterium]